jgi:hypothetical protein
MSSLTRGGLCPHRPRPPQDDASAGGQQKGAQSGQRRVGGRGNRTRLELNLQDRALREDRVLAGVEALARNRLALVADEDPAFIPVVVNNDVL